MKRSVCLGLLFVAAIALLVVCGNLGAVEGLPGDLSARVAALEQRLLGVEQRLLALEGTSPTTAPGQPAIEIRLPANDSAVGKDVVVEGLVRADKTDGREAVVLVHPMQANMLWVQPLPMGLMKTSQGYQFRTHAYLGTTTQGVGEMFELYAIWAKEGTYKEGSQLERLPKDLPVSQPVLVKRAK